MSTPPMGTRIHLAKGPKLALTACYVVQALGVVMAVVSPSVPGFIVSSIPVGLPFSAINFFVMAEVRPFRPHHVARCIGLMTALYGLGLITGPPLVNAILTLSPDARRGFGRFLKIAAASLMVGSALLGNGIEVAHWKLAVSPCASPRLLRALLM